MTLRGRLDWSKHYAMSAALAAAEHPLISDAGGLMKKQLDALTLGSGFSFGDLAADRAGVRFANAGTSSEAGAKSTQARAEECYDIDDLFPPIIDLPENLTLEQFRRNFGELAVSVIASNSARSKPSWIAVQRYPVTRPDLDTGCFLTVQAINPFGCKHELIVDFLQSLSFASRRARFQKSRSSRSPKRASGSLSS